MEATQEETREEMDGSEGRVSTRIKSEEAKRIMAVQFNAEFNMNEQLRRERENEWIEDIRQCRGKYDPEDEARIPKGRSKIYPKYTRSKEVPCVAKLNNLLFPNSGRNWQISETPEPELRPDQLQIVLQQLIEAKVEPTPENYNRAIKQFAKKACTRMDTVMNDQLLEGKYKDVMKRSIKSGVRLGTGVIKGPLVKAAKRREAVNTEKGLEYVTRTEKKPIPKFVPVWNWYPDMTATEVCECAHFYELHSMTRHDLRMLAKRAGFDAGTINHYIKLHPDGDYKFKQWEIDLQTISEEIISRAKAKRYQVLERYGYIDGDDLIAMGVTGISEKDGSAEFYTNIWILGNEIIKISIDATAKDPETNENTNIYHVFYYEKDETSIFGTGLPRSIRDTQLTISASARMLLDNAARTSGGGILEIVDELFPDEDTDDIFSMKIFHREGRGAELQYPGIRIHKFDSHIQDYIEIIRLFKSIGDDESTMPAFLAGDSMKNETAQAASIRMSNTNVTVGDIVMNFDAANESFLRALYAWNMEFNEDETVKGDYLVRAVGSPSLLTKELRAQTIDEFTRTVTPADEPYIKRRWFLAERLKARDIEPEDGLNTEEEAQKIIASNRDAEAEALAKAKAKADILYTESKAAHMQAKAEEEGKHTQLKTVETLTKAAEAMKDEPKEKK